MSSHVMLRNPLESQPILQRARRLIRTFSTEDVLERRIMTERPMISSY